jgi:bifunctional non-homologous end joining protein LigD
LAPVKLEQLRPMKAVTAELPVDEHGWAFEIKWDGMRILTIIRPDAFSLWTGNGIDASSRYPELAPIADALRGHTVVLDGEVVAFDEGGRPSFGRLQHRMHVGNAAEIRRLTEAVPVTYVVFDLLHLNGHDVMPLPYVERRRLLRELVPGNGGWTVPAHRLEGEGASLLSAAKEQGLEGVMAKRLDSPYLPGKRSPMWRKAKARRQQEFVVGGWQPGEGNREGYLGSLLVGVYESGKLRYCGKVGTGFSSRELERLRPLLTEREIEKPPFDPAPPRLVSRAARWTRPDLVAEVQFGEWTDEGILRHPSYLGLRDDKAPTDVVREG